MRPLILISTLILSHASHGQSLTTEYVEKSISSSCPVIMPLLPTGISLEFSKTSSLGPFGPISELVEHLRTDAENYYEDLTRIAADFGFESLEEWATISDRVTIVRLSLTSRPGQYDVREPSPDDVAVLSEAQRLALRIYPRIAALLNTVTEEEKAVVRPFLDELAEMDCFERN